MNGKLTILIEEDYYWFYAYCPELKGCQSQADTFEEAFVNIKEAIDLYIGTLDIENESLLLSRNIFTTSYEVAIA
jgi:predicted RNase H-like HicB family nuclease